MVSKASEDLPDPLSPVMTVRVLRGISTSMFFRLCWRAPCTVMRSSIEKVREVQAASSLSRALCRFRKLRYNLMVMKCRQCGEKLRRVHRTFIERFSYMAIYECHKCERKEPVPRRFRYHLGPTCRCPLCGTYRVVKLKTPDRIDRRHGGFLNLVERILGYGRLFH